MAWLRPTFAILIALFGSIADAGPQAVPRKYHAGFYLEGCKKSSSVRPAPHLVLIVVSRPNRPIDLPASLDRA
jgi:hypothetical protein